MLPLRPPGRVVVPSLGTSCSANVSSTLICAWCRAAGKSVAPLKAENAPNDPLIRPPLAWDEATRSAVEGGGDVTNLSPL